MTIITYYLYINRKNFNIYKGNEKSNAYDFIMSQSPDMTLFNDWFGETHNI